MQIPIFVLPLSVGVIIQIIKLIIDYKKDNIFDITVSGWFPSVHSWMAASLSTTIFILYWVYSVEFAISFVFSLLFWYDASNVRYEAWKQATVINNIRHNLSEILLEQDHEPIKLKERLWHTFFEVIWGIIIGTALTLVIIYLFKLKGIWIGL